MPAQQRGRIRPRHSKAAHNLNNHRHPAQSAVANLPGMSSENVPKKIDNHFAKKAQPNHDDGHAYTSAEHDGHPVIGQLFFPGFSRKCARLQ
ncbi:hypothetical protein ACI2KS_22855 [Pseudomonas sp. NPDC087358]|uniref:hypothetical protein n=1 Tax=Pseudomonas sp. NPDC087358 TaxID=3364439 RepID=UPI00384F16D1